MATLVLVPGICGSTLRRVVTGTKVGYNVWMPYSMLNPVGLRNLALDAQGANDLYAFPGTSILPTGLLSAYYGAAIADFSSRIRTLVFPYDWRMGSVQNGSILAAKLSALLATDQVYLVGHSNGGIVARIADAQLAADPHRANLIRIVQVGTPNYGSWEAPRNFAGIPSWLAPYARQMNRGLYAVAYEAAIAYLQTLIAHFRCVYELMPDAWAGPFAGRDTALALYQLASWTVVNPTVNQFLLTWGQTFTQGLPAIPELGKYVAVAGYDGRTTDGLDHISELALPDSYGYTSQGDGVVTVSSAVLSGVKAIYTTASHAKLLLDSAVRQAIWEALPNGLQVDRFVD